MALAVYIFKVKLLKEQRAIENTFISLFTYYIIIPLFVTLNRRVRSLSRN